MQTEGRAALSRKAAATAGRIPRMELDVPILGTGVHIVVHYSRLFQPREHLL